MLENAKKQIFQNCNNACRSLPFLAPWLLAHSLRGRTGTVTATATPLTSNSAAHSRNGIAQLVRAGRGGLGAAGPGMEPTLFHSPPPLGNSRLTRRLVLGILTAYY